MKRALISVLAVLSLAFAACSAVGEARVPPPIFAWSADGRQIETRITSDTRGIAGGTEYYEPDALYDSDPAVIVLVSPERAAAAYLPVLTDERLDAGYRCERRIGSIHVYAARTAPGATRSSTRFSY